MDTSYESSWSAPTHSNSLVQLSDGDLDDLGNLFELGDIDLSDLNDVTSSSFNDNVPSGQPSSHQNAPYAAMGASVSLHGTATHDFGAQYGVQTLDPNQTSAQAQPPQYLLGDGPQRVMDSPFPNDMYPNALRQPFQSTSQPHQFTYQTQPGFPSGNYVPPTPNSYEMHGMRPPQMDAQQRAILEQRFQVRKDDATVFTPMVSPAGTPQFSLQNEFTVPGVYFSPLTSPMLHAQQNTSQHTQGYYTNPSTAGNSNAASPAEINIDTDMTGGDLMLPEAHPPSQQPKPRRKPATPRSIATSRAQQSPIQKAQKRKSSRLSSVLTTPTAEALARGTTSPGKLAPTSAGPHGHASFRGSSDDGSISPEPLSEVSMGPPPRPISSTNPSPALGGRPQRPNSGTDDAAATPKSLLSKKGMQPPGSTASVGANALAELALEDLELPEAAAPGAPKASLARLETMLPMSAPDSSTSHGNTRKTPTLGSASAMPTARPMSSNASPVSHSPMIPGTPLVGSTPAGMLRGRKDGKTNGNSKKRGVSGSSSTLVSPALRPRISPSIKPLLPEGTALHSSTHALLLASKSNYQNLLEGNHLPGVTYPDSLSTGLTSKRTSHKVAEQGRRNRINEALKEMQSLLPKSAVVKAGKDGAGTDSSPAAEETADGDGDADGKDGKNDIKSNGSKAATVESANEYIRKLQRENAELQKQYAEMKRQLELRSSESASDSSSVAIEAEGTTALDST